MDFITKEKEFWDKNAREYTTLKYETNKSKKEVEKIVDKLKRIGIDILELGGGSGRFTEVLEKKFPFSQIYSMDISNGMQDIAKQKCRRTEFMLGDVRSIPFPDNYFNLVFCAGIMHHLVNYSEGLNESIRVTKQGGYIFFYEPSKEYVDFWNSIKRKLYFLKPARDFIFRKRIQQINEDNIRYTGSPAERIRFKKFGTTTIHPQEITKKIKENGLQIMYVKKSRFRESFEMLVKKN